MVIIHGDGEPYDAIQIRLKFGNFVVSRMRIGSKTSHLLFDKYATRTEVVEYVMYLTKQLKYPLHASMRGLPFKPRTYDTSLENNLFANLHAWCQCMLTPDDDMYSLLAARR